MNTTKLDTLINTIFEMLEGEVAGYKNAAEDWSISQGNAAICIITKDGKVYGKVFGNDQMKQRKFFGIAWQKASQVWITGYKTGDYERVVFGGNMNPEDSPIELPDLIGWVGGQPVQLGPETMLSIGFSGFRGFNDIEIVQKVILKAMHNQNSAL